MTSVGERVAFHRKQLGLSQAELAGLVDRSESWVSQVERGVRPVDRLSVLQKVADALNTSVEQLRDGTAPERELVEDRPEGLDMLRLALSGHPALPSLLNSYQQTIPGIDQLQALYEPVWRLVHESRYSELAPILSELISGLERAVRRVDSATEVASLRRLLSDTYQATAAMLAKVSEHDAAWVAADRAAMVAEQLADPLMVAASQFRMAHVFLSLRQLAQAQKVAHIAADALYTRVEKRNALHDELSLYGAFHLVLAIVAARENERQDAQTWLETARQTAERLGEDRNDFGTEFGPTNVRLHAVAISVELGDAGAALDLAGEIDPSSLSPERQARFFVDVARAQAMRRQIGEALRSLERAESVAPEQTRTLRRAAEVARDLVQLAGGRVTPEIRALAERFDLAL